MVGSKQLKRSSKKNSQRTFSWIVFVLNNQKKKWPHERKFSLPRQRWCEKLTFFWLLLLFFFCNLKTATSELFLHGEPTTITPKRKTRKLTTKEARKALAEHYVKYHGWPADTVTRVVNSFTRKITGTPLPSPVQEKTKKKLTKERKKALLNIKHKLESVVKTEDQH